MLSTHLLVDTYALCSETPRFSLPLPVARPSSLGRLVRTFGVSNLRLVCYFACLGQESLCYFRSFSCVVLQTRQFCFNSELTLGLVSPSPIPSFLHINCSSSSLRIIKRRFFYTCGLSRLGVSASGQYWRIRAHTYFNFTMPEVRRWPLHPDILGRAQSGDHGDSKSS